MKAPLLPLFACFAWMVPLASFGQIIQSNNFFEPDFRARQPGATTGLVTLGVTNDLYNQTGSSGNYSWSHNAGGLIQTRANVTAPITGLVVANLDVQLAAYTETVGNSLVFGREVTTSATLLGIPVTGQGDALNGLVGGLAGASALYNWSSDATVSGLTIVPDQLYRVTFQVTRGAGLPVNLLSSSTFGITTEGITGASSESSELLNVLNLVTVGPGSSTGTFTFDFQSESALSELNFNFAATSGVGVSGLGGLADNQNVLTFSNFQVTAVPEAGTTSIVMLCGVMGLLRRRRR